MGVGEKNYNGNGHQRIRNGCPLCKWQPLISPPAPPSLLSNKTWFLTDGNNIKAFGFNFKEDFLRLTILEYPFHTWTHYYAMIKRLSVLANGRIQLATKMQQGDSRIEALTSERSCDNLPRVTDYPHWGFQCFPQSLQINQTTTIFFRTLSTSIIHLHPTNREGRDTSVGIATGYELDGRHSIPGRSKKCFSSLQSPGRLWGPISLLHNGFPGLLHGGKVEEVWSSPFTSI
jgi:hypothetical protein